MIEPHPQQATPPQAHFSMPSGYLQVIVLPVNRGLGGLLPSDCSCSGGDDLTSTMPVLIGTEYLARHLQLLSIPQTSARLPAFFARRPVSSGMSVTASATVGSATHARLCRRVVSSSNTPATVSGPQRPPGASRPRGHAPAGYRFGALQNRPIHRAR